MKKTLAVTLVALSLAMSSSAIRPLHKLFPVKQSDGTTLMLYKHGNDGLAFYSTDDDKVVVRNEAGTLCYAVLKDGKLVASDVVVHATDKRTEAEKIFVSTAALNPKTAGVAAFAQKSPYRSMAKIGSSTPDGLGKYGECAGGALPSVGKITIPVLMVEFSDTKFQETTTIEKVNRFFNQEGYNEDNTRERGSVRDYFLAQSRGMFDPTFDVAAKVTLNKQYAFYGRNGSRTDVNVISMIREAVNDAISQGVDFSKYYVNGKVPNIIVYYAGCGEATGGDENTIWPHEMDYSTSYGTQYSFSSYFVGNELNGSKNNSSFMGMGVMVHELGHALGLPDFYCTDDSYEGNYAYGEWSVMELGPYTNGAYAPIGYTAYERSFMGWYDMPTISDPEAVLLENPNDENSKFAVMFRNPNDEKEYFILENRQPGTWFYDQTGLMVHRIKYKADSWNYYNDVNNNEHYKRAMLVCASGGELKSSALATDLFGNSVNNIPAFPFYDKTQYTDMPIYRIIEHPDGTITFSVKDKNLVSQHAVSNGDIYEKVTDASTLASGDEILFVNAQEGLAMSRNLYSGTLQTVSVKVEGDKVYGNDNVMPLNLRASGPKWTMQYNNKNYLTAVKAGLKLQNNVAAGSIASIAIENGNAKVEFGGSAANKNLGYNADNIYFATFAAAQNNMQIYRKTASTGINAVSVGKTATDGKMYNLSGQQVGEGYKGIVIVNGKKMLKK